jgi:hypothetical protein
MAATTTQPKAIAPAKFEAALVKMDAGVQQTLPAGTSLNINGVVMKQPAIDTTLQGWIATFKAADQAKAAFQQAVAARVAITVAANTFYKTLKALLKSQFAGNAAALASFGLAVDKPISSSATTKILAVAKRAQTRTVRGTKSKKAAAKITVVGQPPLSVNSDGDLQLGAPPVNLAAASSTSSSNASSTPASTAGSSPAAAPAGSGASGTPGSGTTGA